ncbi:MAG: MotA/TolQ/ExbB proton channel family protein [Crocinitomicaceae bacterium]|nr:MotA/TolQ/ExbB proton channel family protein [Crocinitomicaceae bacterium]
MKKVISSMMIAGMLIFGMTTANAQETAANDSVDTEMVAADTNGMEEVMSSATEEVEETTVATTDSDEEAEQEPLGFASVLKQKFIEGDAFWMGIVLIALIIGLALCIERIVYLNLSSINTKNFLNDVEAALQSGGVEEAKELCRNTRGPIASIYYQGFDRSGEGIEAVEKSVVSYGGVQMGLLEKGIPWISLFIALAPMLGFMGTVIGMIQAFDKIVSDGQVSPTTVAGGIKVALLTTVFGLIAAIFLQIFYNYIVSKVDAIVNEMENASITLVDMMLKYKVTSK